MEDFNLELVIPHKEEISASALDKLIKEEMGGE